MSGKILAGFLLGAAVIGYDHLIRELPQPLAVALYSIAVILFVVGIYESRKEDRKR